MSHVLVSGRAAMAFIRESDENWLLLRYEEPDKLVPCLRSEVALHLDGCHDVQQLGTAYVEEVRNSLFDAVDLTEATDLTLWLLDDRLSDSTRAAASGDLDELLGYPELREMWAGIFWARPIPAHADLRGAISIARSVNSARVAEALADLQSGQEAISAVRLAWSFLSREPEYFGESAREIEALCIRKGIFREFAIAHRDGRLDDALFRWAPDVEARRRCPKWIDVCNAWKRALSSRPVDSRVDRLPELGEVFEDDADGPRRKRKGYDRTEISKKINSQKQLILKCLDQGDENRAGQLVDELVAYQLEYGGPSFAVKSLCDLAQRAYERDLLAIHRRLSERSIELDDSDGWAWAQFGHALLLSEDYDGALDAYKRAEEYGEAEVGGNGRAQVLKALGRYDDALAAFDETIRQHPANAVAKTGRAEVLKALERYDDALAAFDETIRQHPANVFAKTGRWSVLMEMGKAEQVWNEAADVPSNANRWINQHIRAMAAMQTHRFADARSLLTEGLATTPRQRDRDYFRSGLAILYLREQRFLEASVELSKVSSPSMRGPRLVLDAHVAGALMNSSRVEELLGQVANLHSASLKDVCTELRHRYVLRIPDVHSDDWLLEREIRMCGLAA